MLTRRELENAIAECESNPSSFNDCQKLATFYTIYQHCFAEKEPKESRSVYTETVIDDYGDSEFLDIIRDREAGDVWAVMDELMMTLQVVNPKLYNATLRKIDSL